MNLYGLQKLRCPHCKDSLTLHIFAEETLEVPLAPLKDRAPEADEAALTRVVRDGLLVCPDVPCLVPDRIVRAGDVAVSTAFPRLLPQEARAGLCRLVRSECSEVVAGTG